MTLAALAFRHCRASGSKFTLAGFVPDFYGISLREVQRISRRRHQPSPRVLAKFHAAQVRLFPGEKIPVPLPDGAVAEIGGDALTITYPPSSNSSNSVNSVQPS